MRLLGQFYFFIIFLREDFASANKHKKHKKQFLVRFIDSDSCREKRSINISQNEQEKTLVEVSFFIKTCELEL